MTLTANQIMTDDGHNLPLQRDFRDALATYARRTWPRDVAKCAAREWKLPLSTASNLLKGKASDATIAHVLRVGGWRLGLSIVGAVIGESLDDFITSERERIAREQRAAEERAHRLSAMARDLPSLVSRRAHHAVRMGAEPAGAGRAQADLGADRHDRSAAG